MIKDFTVKLGKLIFNKYAKASSFETFSPSKLNSIEQLANILGH